ncbi:MAG TPA: hypothetical protein VM577_20620 [Anaerovoracaceae bacterium]|nr:hypothetical protein [Anaerovoracaceae bacterium]
MQLFAVLVTGETFAAVRDPVDELYIYRVAFVVIELAIDVKGPVAVIFALVEAGLVAEIDILDTPCIITVPAGFSLEIANDTLKDVKIKDKTVISNNKYFDVFFILGSSQIINKNFN